MPKKNGSSTQSEIDAAFAPEKPHEALIGSAETIELAKPRTAEREAPRAPEIAETFGDKAGRGNLDAIMRIPVSLQVVLGSATMPVSSLMKLGRGAVVPLDHRVGEPVDVVVNGRVVARGEVVVVEDDNSRFGVSLTEIVGANAAGG